ncbi:GTPase/DUF3482 domain-containing protein [Alcaligenaceae bacterium CGII-47]|nr:GTPase/DUF3482 domain-containing protein [Alcaligenaceae bacterium CGII-47]
MTEPFDLTALVLDTLAKSDVAPIDLAVVGHTNTGKTSLLRTLLRDPNFGEVADRPGTTRHVESAQLLIGDGTPVLTLRDTPGLEDSMAVLDYLERLVKPDERPDGPERIRRFLDSPEGAHRFEQEARVLSTVLTCHAALYVIDVRDPILAKHKDELSLLTACGRPILPILNFTRSPYSQAHAWRESLARLGLHITVDFDTVAPALDGETQLIDRLSTLLEGQADTLQRLKQDLAEQHQHRRQDAARLVAELLLDAAALRLPCESDKHAQYAVTQTLRERTRKREQQCVQALLKLYHFNRSTFPDHVLPLEGERWGMDLFHPLALKAFGIQLGKGMATGAVAGATIDAMTGGLSLGAATLIGAAAGGLWQGTNQWGKRLMGRLAGHLEITIDDPVLDLLALRQLALIRALEQRGHAALTPIDPGTLLKPTEPISAPVETTDKAPADPGVSTIGKNTLPDGLRALLHEARSQPQWSSLGVDPLPDTRREQHVKRIASILTKALS